MSRHPQRSTRIGRNRRAFTVGIGVFIVVMMTATAPVDAQGTYRRPPADVARIVSAPPLPSVSVDPTNTTMLLIDRQAMPTIADQAQPMLRLAGRRINPDTNARHGNSGMIGLTLKSIADGGERVVDLPDGVRLSSVKWAPDGSQFAFAVHRDSGVELWMGDVATAKARALSGPTVNAIAAGGFQWMPDGRRLLAAFVSADRGEAPQRSPVPTGPVTQEASGRVSPVRTYQDLLADPHDEALFDYYFTAQLAFVDAATGERSDLGKPAIYGQISPSPDGQFLLVQRIVEPFSYQVTMSSFPSVLELWDLHQNDRRELTRTPLADQVPIGGVRTGPRSHRWRSSLGATHLFWIEALDGGDPNAEASHRDRIMMLAHPMDPEAVEVARLEDRFAGMTWLEGRGVALVGEYDRDERWSRTWSMDLSRPQPVEDAKLIWSRNVQDRYGDPGRPLMTTNSAGRSVAQHTGPWVFLSGSGATPQGDRPFFVRQNLETLERRELWRNEGESYETFVDQLPDHRILTKRETPDEPPNYYVLDLDHDTRTAITAFEHPSPELRDVYKELVTYERSDGVKLSATLYLPPGYREGVDPPLPLIVWAYPLEYNDAFTAGQVRGSPHRFTSIRGSSHLFLLLQGYAIMDRATMPVVGSDPETVNDTFISQIVDSAQAAIDYAADRGVADPKRVGVGGHSYGAFMTANLLAHCDLFSAGIARSGAYNRTLTPFGFQSERRTFWEAPDVYFKLSPFMHANKIDEPILLIHGERDNNSGTFPIQSRRLYHAVKGHGGTVRLVMLPHESHGYRAEESIMHVLAEMIDWFDRHVKRSAESGDG